MAIQRKGQDPKQIKRLTSVVYRAIDFLAPHFGINPSGYRDRYPIIYLGPPGYGYGEMGLTIQTQEGDPSIGHETGHLLHEWIGPEEVTGLPKLFGSPEYEVCEAVATYAEALYLRKPIPDDIPFDLAQLIVMDKMAGEIHFEELGKLTRRLNGEKIK